jgi:hypothetical protein
MQIPASYTRSALRAGVVRIRQYIARYRSEGKRDLADRIEKSANEIADEAERRADAVRRG